MSNDDKIENIGTTRVVLTREQYQRLLAESAPAACASDTAKYILEWQRAWVETGKDEGRFEERRAIGAALYREAEKYWAKGTFDGEEVAMVLEQLAEILVKGRRPA